MAAKPVPLESVDPDLRRSAASRRAMISAKVIPLDSVGLELEV